MPSPAPLDDLITQCNRIFFLNYSYSKTIPVRDRRLTPHKTQNWFAKGEHLKLSHKDEDLESFGYIHLAEEIAFEIGHFSIT